jgi:hypothetical protein
MMKTLQLTALALAMLIGINLQAQVVNASNQLVAENPNPGVTFPLNETDELLWDQNWEDPQATTQGLVSTWFGGLTPSLVVSADDFMIPEGETWVINSLWTRGFLSFDAGGNPWAYPDGFGYTIYADDNGEPGEVLFEDIIEDPTLDPTFVQLDLATSIILEEGVYWIGMYGYFENSAASEQGRWNVYMWNPTDYYGEVPMLNDHASLFGLPAGWHSIPDIGVAYDALDFAIWGEVQGPPAIPTTLYENWESYNDFTTDLSPWITIDVQGEPTWTAGDFDFPGEGDPFAFMAFNPNETDPPIVAQHPAVDGDKYAVAIQSTIIGDDKWLISPKLMGTETTELSFYVKSITADYGLERFKVLVSTTGTDPEDFTKISDGDYLEAPIEWTMFEFDLSAYDGEEFHFAIQFVSHDSFIFMLDAITVTEETTGSPALQLSETSIFPNPAVNSITVLNQNLINEIKVYDLAGRQMLSQVVADKNASIDVSSLNNGLYIMQVITETGFESHKIQIAR